MDGSEPKPIWSGPNLAIAEVRWSGPSTIGACVVDGFRNRIIRLAPGVPPAAIDLPLSAAAFDVSADGTIAFVVEDFDHLPEIYLRTRTGAIRQLTHLQQGWDGVRLAKTSVFLTRSFDATMIEAALMKSAAPVTGKTPLVPLVHGVSSSNYTAGYG